MQCNLCGQAELQDRYWSWIARCPVQIGCLQQGSQPLRLKDDYRLRGLSNCDRSRWVGVNVAAWDCHSLLNAPTYQSNPLIRFCTYASSLYTLHRHSQFMLKMEILSVVSAMYKFSAPSFRVAIQFTCGQQRPIWCFRHTALPAQAKLSHFECKLTYTPCPLYAGSVERFHHDHLGLHVWMSQLQH